MIHILKGSIYLLYLVIGTGLILSSCSKKLVVSEPSDDNSSLMSNTIGSSSPSPPAIIYKTRANYFDKVPVILSQDKSRIVGYPGVKDVLYMGDFTYPSRLIHGFLLDNKGVNENTAFLDITYEEYSGLENTPSSQDLFNRIMDADPFVEMYDCGSRHDFKNIKVELNEAINLNLLNNFSKMK